MKEKPIYIAITKNYVVEKYHKKPKDTIEWRTKVIFDKNGYRHIARIAIRKKEGPRGGHTILTSIWHPKNEPKAKKLIKDAFKLKIPVYVIHNRKKKRIKSYTIAKKLLTNTGWEEGVG